MPINYSEIMAYALECKNMLYPIVSSSVYVIICYLLKLKKNDFNNLYKNNYFYRNIVKFCGATYNLFMTVFSAIFFIQLCKLMQYEYNTIANYDIWLNDKVIQNPEILNLCWLFCHSKTFEYIDTMFVLIKGGTPIFLQKYHHFGAVWTWFVLLYVDSSAVLIACLFNSFVHAVMYLYYFSSVFDDSKTLLPIKPFITSLQLVQLCSGFYIGSTSYVLRHSKVLGWNNKYILSGLTFLIYDIFLISLFLQFSYRQYFQRKNKKN